MMMSLRLKIKVYESSCILAPDLWINICFSGFPSHGVPALPATSESITKSPAVGKLGSDLQKKKTQTTVCFQVLVNTEGCTNLQSNSLLILGVSGELNGCGMMTAISGLSG